jgi:predicted AlkP superfamily phosphohydrolase/phosphomutase
VNEEKLPTIAKLMKNGVWGELGSCMPPITMPAWACMFTGKNPGKIGSVYFLMRDLYSYNFKPVKLNIDKLNPIWKILNKFNKKSNLFYIPTILPSLEELNGLYIPGNFVVGNILPSPKLKKIIEKYKLDEAIPKLNNVSLIQWWKENTKKHFDLISHFLNQSDNWDLLIHVIYSNDRISHLFWKYIDPDHPDFKEDKNIYNEFLNYYRIFGKCLSKIIKKCELNNINLFIVSDHGHGPRRKRLCLNKWLLDNDYLYINKSKFVIKNNWRNYFKQLIIDNRITKSKFIYEFIKKNPKLRIFFQSFFEKKDINTNIIKWDNTKAYFSGYNGININMKGREPLGIVTKNNYDNVRNNLIRDLKKIKDTEAKQNVIKNIWKREELYHGKYINKLPDIIIEYKNTSEYESVLTYNDSLIKKSLFYRTNNPPSYSSHTLNGIFLAYGPDICKLGKKISNIKIYDIAPTILYLFDLPIPKDIDGKVIKTIFDTTKKIYKKPPKFVSPFFYKNSSIKENIKPKIKKIRKKIKK